MSLVAYGNSSGDEDDEEDEYHLNDDRKTNPVLQQFPASNEYESKPLKLHLPTPKSIAESDFIEEDDEFLRKKPKAMPEEPPKPLKRNIVKITIPALPKPDETEKLKGRIIGAEPNKLTGLLNILPKPSFSNFKTSTRNSNTNVQSSDKKQSTRLIPHSVAKNNSKKQNVKVNRIVDDQNSGSDESDNDDFFSFHSEQKLPEVSQHEIDAIVLKKANEIKTAPLNYLQNVDQQVESDVQEQETIPQSSAIDDVALVALCGSSAKRHRRDEGASVVIDLSGDQVLPNKDEWLRNHLQSSTEYQPKGLVDQEPAPGTRKKHQITYLAHQAKANEQELQAMWAANRHTRRQTQNKYGF